LGFGFDKDNMKILFGDNALENSKLTEAPSYATAYGLDQGKKDKYPFIHFYDLTCAQFVKNSSIFQI
jgi:hypothetical protein